tara:strand:+ start:44 stop:1102 length:1059 start_codon:yes stop_codon:yes gene_type:complete
MKIRLNRRFEISRNSSPYIIAEIGSNHNGNLEICKKLVKSAKKAGANCVKFQSWTEKTIFSKKVYEDNFFIADDYRDRTDTNLKKIVKKYSFSKKQLIKIKKFCDQVKIDFLVTPFSREEADFLDKKLKVDAFKIASMDLNNYDFISHVAKKNKPIILSTGLSNSKEIKKAIKTVEKSGNKKLIILHCVAIYPPKYEEINLNRISTLKKTYPYPVGFSDHSLGFEAAIASVALGSCLIEKHFTLNKKMEGWDHHMSIDESELKKIVDCSKIIHASLGNGDLKRIESKERVESFRRSLVASRDIKKGEVLKRQMIDTKRPGYGLAPEKISQVVGKKAKKNINYDELIYLRDLK